MGNSHKMPNLKVKTNFSKNSGHSLSDLSLSSWGLSVPSHCPVSASVLLMTMSISVAPSATAKRTSCSRVSSGVWPAGKPVATGETRENTSRINVLQTHFSSPFMPLRQQTLPVAVTQRRGDLPEATARLELAAFSDLTASATRDGYTHTAAVVTPETTARNKTDGDEVVCVALCRLNPSLSRQSGTLNKRWHFPGPPLSRL